MGQLGAEPVLMGASRLPSEPLWCLTLWVEISARVSFSQAMGRREQGLEIKGFGSMGPGLVADCVCPW